MKLNVADEMYHEPITLAEESKSEYFDPRPLALVALKVAKMGLPFPDALARIAREDPALYRLFERERARGGVRAMQLLDSRLAHHARGSA